MVWCALLALVLMHCAVVDGVDPVDHGLSAHDATMEVIDATIDPDPASTDPLVAQGERSVRARHCAGCHQSDNPADGILSGSLSPVPGDPMGVVGYGPNLTSDPDTGLGGWTDDEIIRAIRAGLDDQGAELCVMPRFASIGDDEANAIVAYLRSLPPIARTVTDSVCPDDLAMLDAGDASDVSDVFDATEIVDVGDVASEPEPVQDSATDASRDATVDAPPLPSCTPILVINEIQSGGTHGAADEFVEIFNDSECDASLRGYELKYASATGTAASRRWLGGFTDRIEAHGYVLLAGMGFSGAEMPIGVFASITGTLSATGGGIGLYDPSQHLVDSVGYGTSVTNTMVERTHATAPLASQSIERLPDGHDTNDNSADFVLTATPTPGTANH